MIIPPLRSGINCSDPGFKGRVEADRAGIETRVAANGDVHSLPDDAGLLVRAHYPAFEGPVANGPHLRIGLCLGGNARLVQRVGDARLEGVWRPGTLAITPPDRSGMAACGSTQMIGLAIVPETAIVAQPIDPDRLEHQAGHFHEDPLLVSVLTALHHEADIHGASTAFFEHGIAVILQRLLELDPPRRTGRRPHPLSSARFNRVLAYVDARLEDKLSVVDLAAVAGMDPSGFTRALRARTGLAPYAWLTGLRMERAAYLIATGMPITQAASHVGYLNAGKFAAAFRRTLGYLPSAAAA